MNRSILDEQLSISSSSVSRAQQSANSFFQGFTQGDEMVQMKNRHTKRERQTLKLDKKIVEKAEKIDLIPLSPVFSRTFALTTKDKIN